MNTQLTTVAEKILNEIEAQGVKKLEHEIMSAQGVVIKVAGRDIINFCTNNYLGLANEPRIVKAAKKGLDEYGYGLASVRFISGTQKQHHELEATLAQFFGMEDAILYSSAFDANAGLFEALLNEEDAVISDALNHASIIDGIRLSKAERHRYGHSDMAELEHILKQTQNKRIRLIVSDGVFSMDGEVAKLKEICDLAEKYNAAVLVDDSHGSGVLGESGRGSPELTGTLAKIDLLTSTFSKAFGGGGGGYTVGPRTLIELLRQKSRPYIFSNSLTPSNVAASKYLLEHFNDYQNRRVSLLENARYFREVMNELGFKVAEGVHPIVPIMFGEAAIAKKYSERLIAKGFYVVGFWFPVVPEGLARIRVQLSALHSHEQVERLAQAFDETMKNFQL